MFEVGEIVSYLAMCQSEGASLQHGMNFHLNGPISVILMSRRPNAPYEDRIEDEGRTLIYEGHNVPRKNGGPDPRKVDQPMYYSGGTLSRNGQFYEAAKTAAKENQIELVRVYEKIKPAIWSYNGLFRLLDAWLEDSGKRKVFRFKLTLTDSTTAPVAKNDHLIHDRVIPSSVKFAVWKRDNGKCVKCGANNNLHFDHILPFSKGGTSLTEANIQLLCARHNLRKSNKIE